MNPTPAARALACALGIVAAAPLPRAASAQNVLIDRGTFRLSVGGREIGRDSFNISRTGAGADTRIVAQGWVELGARRLNTVLQTTSDYGLTSYQEMISGSETARYDARVNGRRMQVTTVSPAGEQTREARHQAGAVVLEENVAHHYFLVAALAREGGSLPLIVPRVDEQSSLEVLSISPERMRVGTQELDARRLRLSANGLERQVWVDGQGRVLRVEIPSTGFAAERLRPPA